MTKENLILICASLIITQLVVVQCQLSEDVSIESEIFEFIPRGSGRGLFITIADNTFVGNRLDHRSRRVEKIGWKSAKEVFR